MEEEFEENKKEEEILEKRKKEAVKYFKKSNWWVLGILIIILILGVYIRSLPMQDHGGRPGLWDITTNTWTLGPDLDPFLFLRYAKIIVDNGSLPNVDTMRNVPLGYNTAGETKLLPYMIVLTYWVFNIFSDINVEFAAAVFPVVIFAFTIIFFFLFVREIFLRKDEKSKINANIIALISSFFMVVTPIFLSRTVAGIPEKESAAFFLMFLTFYLFLKAWKSENLKKAIIFGILSGISTGLMGLIWGGVNYVFVTIAVSSFMGFILNKIHKKELMIYSSWIIFSFSIMFLFSEKFSLRGLVTSLDTGLAFLVFFILIVDFILMKTKLSKTKLLKKLNLPKNINSLIIAVVLGVILISILFGPFFIINKAKDLNQILFKPVTGRWSVTVAENRQPYFTEWGGSFGPFIKNVPILFWLFFIGSIILFKNMLKKIKKKDSWILTGLYILFFFGLVFSRYSSSSSFNGENFISKLFYYGSALLLIGAFIYYYITYHKREHYGFEEVDYEYLFLFSLFILCLFTARSAVRLIMVLAPIAPIFLSYLIIISINRFRKSKDETEKIIFGVAAILILLLSLFVSWNYYKAIKSQSYNFIPSIYSQQWQKAMEWVRIETPENAVFAHWWDYGYWVQTMGERATVLDGGNFIVYWNYLMGRYVLTGDNQEDSLEFLYTHNATHLLIDSTDIGKYTAFSSIGSDLNYDRYSWVPVMVVDEKQIQETKDSQRIFYSGASGIDEDIIYLKDGEEIFLPLGRAGIAGIIIEMSLNGKEASFKQPEGIFFYEGKQISIPLRYVYYKGDFFDFKNGLEATAYIIQRVDQTSQGIKINEIGSAMYLSPKIMRGFLAQKYLLDDPFDNFPNFKVIHKEQSIIVQSLRDQKLNVEDFIYFQGIQGPIKFWEIKYNGDEEINPEYLQKTPPESITWEF